jgi:hypothetical protein
MMHLALMVNLRKVLTYEGTEKAIFDKNTISGKINACRVGGNMEHGRGVGGRHKEIHGELVSAMNQGVIARTSPTNLCSISDLPI